MEMTEQEIKEEVARTCHNCKYCKGTGVIDKIICPACVKRVILNARKRINNAAKRQRNKEAFESLGITQARFNELVKEAKDNGAIIVVFKLANYQGAE